MTENKIDLKLTPIEVENADRVGSVRLVNDGGRAALITLLDVGKGAPVLHLHFLDRSHAGPARPLLKLDSPFGPPSWDVAGTKTGLAAVWTMPGSAVSKLGYRAPDAAPTVLTGRYPSGVFESPRFVRGEPETAGAVTAIAYEESGRVLALFSGSLEGGQAAYLPLPSAGTGIPTDGLLLRSGAGYLLFAKFLTPGAPGPERKDGHGESIAPGILRFMRLNAKLQPVGAALNPLGDAAVYEFDADLSGDRVFLLATTQRGHAAATAVVSEGGLNWLRSDRPVGADLVSPSLLVTGNAALAAVIESGAPASSKILIGRF